MKRHPQQYELVPRPALCGNEPTAIDLFSGAGGLTLGLSNAGYRVLLSSDWSAPCARTHRRNFPDIPFRLADISKVAGEEILAQTGLRRGELDLLIGGPPCQGFSILGQRLLDDPRNKLFGEFLRITGELLPRVAVIENVPGLATLAGGVLLREIGEAFDTLGYHVECAELLSAQYGVPQMRWRMFFIAWRKDQKVSGCGFPIPTHGTLGIGDLVPNRTVRPDQLEGFVTIGEAISDLPPIAAGQECNHYTSKPASAYQAAMRLGSSSVLLNHYSAKLAPINIERIRRLNPGQDWRDLPRDLLPAGMQRALRKDHTRRFRRMRWDGVARSIITRFRDPKSGEYTHPEQDRTISIREAARIQSFPDWFAFEGNHTEQYDQVGNAVPPLLAKAVGEQLLKVLDGSEALAAPVKSRYRIYA